MKIKEEWKKLLASGGQTKSNYGMVNVRREAYESFRQTCSENGLVMSKVLTSLVQDWNQKIQGGKHV
ncbi:MAG: hypothetical protein Q7S00_00300 [bacterium]|nr:hypothetical protein [bacterium]